MRDLGTDDILSGGSGTNTLTGGANADLFVFDFSTGGSQTVTDFEAWDTLQFNGFNYASDAAVLALFSQSGNDVIFNDQGVSLTLLDTQLALLTDNQIEVL